MIDFHARPVVAGIILSGPVNVGDTIHIVGHSTDMQLVVESMQIDHADVAEAGAGDSVGIKVPDRAWDGDKFYKVTN